MSLTSLIPPPYRWLILVLLVAAVWGHGFVKGLHSGEAKLAVFTSQEGELGAKQDASNARLLVKQKEINQNEKDSASIRESGLRAFYATKLRNTSTSGSSSPAPTNSTSIPDGAPSEPSTCPAGTTTGISEISAAKDALMVLEWQHWATTQGFKVE